MKKKIIYDVEFSKLEEGVLIDLENNNIFKKASVELMAVVGKKEDTLEKILSLREGDLIKLNREIEKDIDLYVSDVKILSGKIVQIKGKNYLEVVKV